jgi:NADPH-dependent 2,4-dienoyl-CoA reductase/sulfur reductase-like enzyme
MKKVLKIIGIIFGAFIVILIIAGISGSKDNNQGKEDAAKIIKGEFKDQEVTEESIKSVLANLKEASYSVMSEKEITQIEVSDDLAGISEDISDGKIITVHFKPEDVWDAKDSLKMTAGTAVAVMRRLFAHPKTVSVTVWVDGDFTDQYGKTETAKATLVQITRQTADKIEWDKFKDMVLVDYNKLFDIADTQYIHPAILKAI